VKKAAYLICVIVAVLLEQVTRLSFAREVVIIYFVITETLSVLENCKALGIRITPAIYNAIDLLKAKKAPGEGSVSPSGDPEDTEEEDP
jgi:phage-related holin